MQDETGSSGKQRQTVVDGVVVGGNQQQPMVIGSSQW